MKNLLLIVSLSIVGIYQLLAQYPTVTIRQIQEKPLDSLRVADTLQSGSRWSLQASPYLLDNIGDTVTVIALCVVEPKVLTFTQSGYTMLLYDTIANPYPWGGILVRASSDTSTHIADGFLNVTRGSIIRMTGVLSEFPPGFFNSVTQFQPIPGIPIVILSTGNPIPSPVRLPVGSFYNGLFPAGKVRFSTGELYESMLVEMTGLTLDAKFNTTRGTFSAVDAVGNQVTNYDASKRFTLGHGTVVGPPDSIWAIQYPALGVGTRIDTIRGYMTTVSGSENPRGYRIAPIDRPDIVFGIFLPSISEHRRNPVVVPSDSAARISVRARKQTGGAGIASVSLLYSLNTGPFTSLPMALSDTTYKANIPQQPENTVVRYFMRAVDSLGNSAHLANSAIGGFSSDTSKGFFFYTVLNRPLTIRDIQYTPYLNGRTGYIGANVSVKGIVTADTAHLSVSPLNVAGTNAWFIQTGNAPWNGLWIAGSESTMAAVRNGDSIIVTGALVEQFEVTRIQNLTSPATVITSGRPVPAPVVVPTSTFGPTVGNGTPSAEQWEGMLVQFNKVTVTDIAPVFSDPTEFEVNDGSGAVLVRRDGRHNFSNVQADTITGKAILHVGDTLSFLRGVMHFSFNRYKIVPRRNDDFGYATGVKITHESGIPKQFSLGQNYPNPFNPTTQIEYQLPATARATLTIYNVLGQQVETLVNEVQVAGKYTLQFSASSLASGVYFYRLHAVSASARSGDFVQVKKMILLR